MHHIVLSLLQGLEDCKLNENPARDILTRLTLLSLTYNSLINLADALPAGTVHNIRVLDISYNDRLFRERDSNMWAAKDIIAFDSGWATLQVLGIQMESRDNGLRTTAQVLQRLLQRQADVAEPPRLPATLVYEWHQYQLLRPAQNLAEISE